MKASQLAGGIVNKVRNIVDATTDLVLSGVDQEIVVDRTAGTNIVVPVGLEVGKTFRIHDIGAGRVAFQGQTVGLDSVTLLSTIGLGSLAVSLSQYNVIDLVVIAANTVIVKGDVHLEEEK